MRGRLRQAFTAEPGAAVGKILPPGKSKRKGRCDAARNGKARPSVS